MLATEVEQEQHSCSEIELPVQVLEFLTKKHVLTIIKHLGDSLRPQRYNEIQRALKINTKTLSDRLKDLVEHNIVVRNVDVNEVPPLVQYELKDIRNELFHLFEAILNFHNALNESKD